MEQHASAHELAMVAAAMGSCADVSPTQQLSLSLAVLSASSPSVAVGLEGNWSALEARPVSVSADMASLAWHPEGPQQPEAGGIVQIEYCMARTATLEKNSLVFSRDT